MRQQQQHLQHLQQQQLLSHYASNSSFNTAQQMTWGPKSGPKQPEERDNIGGDEEEYDDAFGGDFFEDESSNNSAPPPGGKRKAPQIAASSKTSTSRSTASNSKPNKKPKSSASKTTEDGEDKRTERNFREKERSYKIARQIAQLRELLFAGGVTVSKETKSSVLLEAANYIRQLQDLRVAKDAEIARLVETVQTMNSGAGGGPEDLAKQKAIRQAVAVVTSDSTSASQSTMVSSSGSASTRNGSAEGQTNSEYVAFQFSSIPMAMVLISGKIVDCNQRFCTMANATRSSVLNLTVFNLLEKSDEKSDLKTAFEYLQTHMKILQSCETPELATAPDQVTFRGELTTGECNFVLSAAKDGSGKTLYFTVQLDPTEEQSDKIDKSLRKNGTEINK
jgi:hypothetical protein